MYLSIIGFLTILSLPLSLASIDKGVNQYKFAERVESFLKEKVSYFSRENYHFLFHTDEESERSSPEFSANDVRFSKIFSSNVDVDRLVVNYLRGVGIVSRPIGMQFINVILLTDPSNFRLFLDTQGSVGAHDKALFVLSQQQLNDQNIMGQFAFWRRQHKLACFENVDFVVPTLSGVEVYDTCYFCGNRIGVLRQIGVWKGYKGNHISQVNIFPDNFSDFNGHLFRVLFVPYPPVIWCEKTTGVNRPNDNANETVCIGSASGPEGNLIDVISRSLNFTTILVDFGSNEENTVDVIEANIGIWDVMISRMSEFDGDIAIGAISVTLPRTHQVHFTQIFNREPHNFAYFTADGSATGVTGPFSTYLWLCLAFAWVSTSLLLCVITRSSFGLRSFFSGLWATGAMLLGQGSAIPALLRRQRPTRILLLCWCWFSFVLISLYDSKLISSLINPAPPDDPTSLDDLLHKSFDMVAPRSSIFAVRDLLKSPDPIYRTAGQRIKVLETLEDCVKPLVGSLRGGPRVAVVVENTFLRWGLEGMLPKNISEETSSRLQVGSAEILASGHAWALRRNGIAYLPKLDKALATLTASGLPLYWLDRTLNRGKGPIPYSNGRRKMHRRSSKEMALPIQLFFMSLFIWAIGLFVSFLIFLFEMISCISFLCNLNIHN